MATYVKHFQTKHTQQTEPVPGKPQVRNSAGGFVFEIDDWKRLDRFLILGCEGSTYYATEKKLTVENAKAVVRCVKADGKRTVARIVEVSDSGRAPKNDPAVFALALCASFGDAVTKEAVRTALPKVCRIGTHLFGFVAAVDSLRGWGRWLRGTVAGWYTDMDAGDMAYQVSKYQNRNGWSHKDVMHLCHLRAEGSHAVVQHWVEKGWPDVGVERHPDPALKSIWAFERSKRAETEGEVVRLIRDHGLVREHVMTKWLKSPAVWEALLDKMPPTAMIRSLGAMTAAGLVTPLSKAVGKVVTELANTERLRKARVHPLAVLMALRTYQQGHGEKGKLTWSPVAQVADALDGAFYTAFGNVEPTNKRWLLALDVSGSMDCRAIAGMAGITPRVGSAAMSLVTAAVEPYHHIMGFSHTLVPVAISPRQRLDDVIHTISRIPMGGTDCSLPMLWAKDNKIDVDTFVVFTDNETWAGHCHPFQVLKEYRQKTGIPAKMIVVGMTATQFTIADPGDAGMLDLCGFDTAAPQLMSEFAMGNV